MITHQQLYLVANFTPETPLQDYLERCRAALEGGVQIMQLRAKHSDMPTQLRLGEQLKTLCLEYGALFVVNDHADLAVALQADMLHVGQSDLALSHALETGLGVGQSTHAPLQAELAQQGGAHYFAVGPIWETPTKQGRAAVGLEYAAWAVEHARVPFFAIGGIDLVNVTQLLERGVRRIAVVRSILDAPDPQKAARAFLRLLENTR